MKLHILKENLHRAVSTVGRFASTKTQLPILSHIGIEASKEGLYFLGTNLDIGIKFRAGGKILEEGSVAVPSKVFSELVTALPLGAVELTFDEKGILEVAGGKVKAKLQTMSMSEFPGIVADKGISLGEFSLADLQYFMQRIGFSVSGDDARPVLTGVYWLLNKGLMAATDGYRLSVVEAESGKKTVADIERLLIPGQLLKEVVSVFEGLLQKKITMQYLPKQKQIVFEGDDVLMMGRVLEGDYPQFEAILPKSWDTEVLIDRKELLEAVRTAAIFARDAANIVRLGLSDGEVVLRANAPQLGENVVRVEAEGGTKEGEIAFNARYLTDFLSHAESERVMFGYGGALKPGVFREEGNKDYTHVIMPVRVREGEN